MRTGRWRQAFWALAREQRVPKLTHVSISVRPYLKGRQQDAGNCYPAAKAAIDGLIDAGVLVDDSPDHLVCLAFYAPEHVSTTDSLVLTIYGVRR